MQYFASLFLSFLFQSFITPTIYFIPLSWCHCFWHYMIFTTSMWEILQYLTEKYFMNQYKKNIKKQKLNSLVAKDKIRYFDGPEPFPEV